VRTSQDESHRQRRIHGSTLLTPADVTAIAALPPREVLVAKVVGSIKGPLYMLAGVLSGPIRGLQKRIGLQE